MAAFALTWNIYNSDESALCGHTHTHNSWKNVLNQPVLDIYRPAHITHRHNHYDYSIIFACVSQLFLYFPFLLGLFSFRLPFAFSKGSVVSGVAVLFFNRCVFSAVLSSRQLALCIWCALLTHVSPLVLAFPLFSYYGGRYVHSAIETSYLFFFYSILLATFVYGPPSSGNHKNLSLQPHRIIATHSQNGRTDEKTTSKYHHKSI